MAKTRRVACVIVRGAENTILMGRRKDNELMTFPGGHIDPGEKPADGAHRELYEETGLTATKLTHVRTEKSKGLMIYVYEAKCEGELTTRYDPDEEAFGWFYCDPLRHCHELHIPLKYNVALKYVVGLN